MKTKNIYGVILLSSLVGTISPALAEEASAGQNITMTLDQVLLLDIDDAFSPTLSPTPPTAAGDKFGNWTLTNNSSKVLITSNVSTAVLCVKSSVDFNAQNVQLGVLFNTNYIANIGTSESPLALGSLVTGTDRASSSASLTYTASEFNPTSTIIPAYGSYDATLTYTIRDGGCS